MARRPAGSPAGTPWSERTATALLTGPALLKALLFPYTIPMALGGVAGIVLVQFGYKYGKAIQVVPGFSSMVVIVPTLAGAATIGEPVTRAGLISIAIITIGVLVMSMSTSWYARTAPGEMGAIPGLWGEVARTLRKNILSLYALFCILYVDTNLRRRNMRVKIQKWGNSLALRIPKAFAVNAELRQGSVVDLSEKGKNITIRPVIEPEPTLEQLLTGINRKNIHREIETGGPVGNEIW